MESDLVYLARYPFLNEARDYVRGLGLGFEEILEHPIYSAAVEVARDRIIDCLGGEYKPRTQDKLSCELTILSYPLARMVVHATQSRTLLHKYASSEAKSTLKTLKAEKPKVIEGLTSRLGIKTSSQGMYFLDFIKLASNLSNHKPEFNLVNRRVKDGWVRVEEAEKSTLLAEWMRQKMIEPIDLKKIPPQLSPLTEEVKNRFGVETQQIRIQKLDDAALPPCIKKMITALAENSAGHNVHFILATFFLGLGLPHEEILDVFRKSPKFDEKLASYQIKYLGGEKSNTKYSAPGCDKIKSYGLCPTECEVKHPLQYYRQNARFIKKKT
ncbi:MAG: hypothetical protein GF334_11775 [Candidatus Altiarchaeales archaeon]|nr:hypothetical protein [Candidatus Altiarchaeales archaeon]